MNNKTMFIALCYFLTPTKTYLFQGCCNVDNTTQTERFDKDNVTHKDKATQTERFDKKKYYSQLKEFNALIDYLKSVHANDLHSYEDLGFDIHRLMKDQISRDCPLIISGKWDDDFFAQYKDSVLWHYSDSYEFFALLPYSDSYEFFALLPLKKVLLYVPFTAIYEILRLFLVDYNYRHLADALADLGLLRLHTVQDTGHRTVLTKAINGLFSQPNGDYCINSISGSDETHSDGIHLVNFLTRRNNKPTSRNNEPTHLVNLGRLKSRRL